MCDGLTTDRSRRRPHKEYYTLVGADLPIVQDTKVHVMCAVVNNPNSAIYVDQPGR